MMNRPVEILLVEDTPGDVWLIRETLLSGPWPKRIHVVDNGEQALDWLSRRAPFADAPRPDIVLLDLNLPRRDGFEVLREIKRNPELLAITVIVLTTSDAANDINSAYDLNANCYVVKPENLEEFTVAIRSIEHFWISLASLPTLTAEVDPIQESGGTPSARVKIDRANGNWQARSSHRRNEPLRAVRWRRRSCCLRAAR